MLTVEPVNTLPVYHLSVYLKTEDYYFDNPEIEMYLATKQEFDDIREYMNVKYKYPKMMWNIEHRIIKTSIKE